MKLTGCQLQKKMTVIVSHATGCTILAVFCSDTIQKGNKMLTSWSEHSIIHPRRRRCHTRRENTKKRFDNRLEFVKI